MDQILDDLITLNHKFSMLVISNFHQINSGLRLN